MSPARFLLWFNSLAGLAVGLGASSLYGEIEWRGTITRQGVPTFALTDTATGDSKWVPMGSAFETYQVSSYDEQRQLLVLTKGGVRTELTLATSHVAATSRPAADDLKNLTGLPLAEALAKRGDTGLRDQLAQLRAAQLSREELNRRLAEAERLAQGSSPGASRRGPAPQGSSNGPTPESARDDLRVEAQRADEEITRLTAQIEKAANDRRQAATASP